MSATTVTATTKEKLLSFADKYSVPLLFLGLALLAVMLSPEAHAGAGGSAFDSVWETVKDWTQGTLGRVIAGAMILVGIVGGIARQSLMAFALGIGGGMGLYNAPDVVESIMSATINGANTVAPHIIALSNGLL